ncbi:glycosyltransferase [Spirosoma foliorum]|uniref:Glycosyltransferase n=1 Tax=Spirosoma foliorum TaxID=2710596 RepID=A0A7G5H3Z3_9BACT|nr:glycosyltransferase family 2 protein [Spirosoma foliorum]QMW05835.1 glycosyltransferase [Spirosoma foliorum]
MVFVNALAMLIASYTGINVFYLSMAAFAGLFSKDKPVATIEPEQLPKMVVMIPSYREDTVILEAAQASLDQDYPSDRFDVVVIADSLRPDTIAKLRSLPVQVIEVSFEVSTKAKALQEAVSALPAIYDVALILDADNVMAPDCLTKLGPVFKQGWKAVQGHRTAKNTNTSVAILDAISEEMNNYLLRKGQRALGMSATLIGSGMAFEYQLFKEFLPQVQVVSGFDKETEMVLLRQRIPVEYVESAMIYDEKVQNQQVFERQRTRWMAAQLRVLRTNFWPGLKELFNGNIDYANKVFQAMLLPRILLLGVLALGFVLSLFSGGTYWPTLMGTQLGLALVTFYIATPGWLLKKVGVTELWGVVVLFVRFVRSILKVKEARNKFIHTPHGIESNNA